MDREILIDFLKWVSTNDFRYSRKFKKWQKHYINETLFYTEYELYLMYKKHISSTEKES